MENEDVSSIQDDISFRRISAYELRRLAGEMDALRAQKSSERSWMLPVVFGVLLTGAIGYIGIVHQMALSDRSEIQRIAAEQYSRTSIKGDVEDLKRRLLVNENVAQQMPFVSQQIRDINVKLDRLLERQPR